MSTVLPLLPDDPEELGGYALIGRLGGGGMGTVFLARSAGGRLAAVKTVRADLRDRPGYRERLVLEAEAARVLGADHTASFLGADPDAALPWLATAYLIGPSLTEAVAAGGPLSGAAVRTLGSGLAGALAALHRAGLVHRDLKPSNVLITAQGPRLIDFGLAQAPGSPRLTAPGGVTGTPAYMSPEQARGERPGAAGDVFALGGVLVFASSGHGPYDTGGPADTLQLLRAGVAPDLSDVPDDAHGLRGTLSACLAPDPDDRPSPDRLLASWGRFDADAFADELPQTLLADLSRRFGEIAAVGVAPLREPAPRRTLSRRAVLTGTAAAAVTGAGITALWLTGSLPGTGSGARSGSGGPTTTPRPGRSTPRPPGTPPAPLWSVVVPFTAGPAVATDEVLVQHDDVLRGLSPADGRVVWEADTSRVGIARAGNRLAGLVFDVDGNASAGYLDPRTGRLGADAPGPAVLGELAYTTEVLAADDTCLYLEASYRSDGPGDPPWAVAYDLAAGQVRWRQRMEGAVRGRDQSLIMSAVVSGGRLICSDPGRIFAVDVRDGRLLWSCRLRTDQQVASPEGVAGGTYPPAASDRHAFDFDGRVTAVDLVAGTVAWRVEPGGNGLLREPVCLNGAVYVADEALHAYDDATGKKTWTHDTDWDVRHVAVADPFRGELYTAVGGGGQAVVAVDTDKRRTAWALSAGALGMSDGADRLVQRGNRLYAQTLDRIAAVPLD
ncbi:protein kinase domain-containing protein [Streptomyces subrutilus]|uniref:protein kinase domain-containing protein n=1 Tax=Streptomyces subrutilus TaxID=36818 RepID=UPI002E0FF281|nr:serine/threonine-protein kinase [Streptomyces subrutilus]